MTDLLKPKWCTYCRKDNHNDSECWCTRADNGPRYPGCFVPLPASLGNMAPMTKALHDWLRDAAEGKA